MMRRYRKGQMFRPPTAAESAVHADAVEAFRSSPAAPQDRPTRGTDILVKTPSGGIAARAGTTIFSAVCTRCVETSFADEKTILETDEPLVVFNTHATDIAGDEYVMTKLTATGMRYAELNSPQLVTVAKDGGVAGSASTNCTWTYTIKDLGGTELDTGLTPHRPRHANAIYTQAPDDSYGLAANIGGAWVLLVAWQEIINPTTCS